MSDSYGMPLCVAVILTATYLLLAVFLPDVLRPRRRYPPGPRGLPFLGNIFDVPRGELSRVSTIYQGWSQTYGGFGPCSN